jgi:ribosomal-protein-serine acetyltransferase
MATVDQRHFSEIASELRQVVQAAIPRLRSIPDSEAARPRAAGKWSAKQIIGHLVDSAANNHQRFVRAQQSTALEFPAYEQNSWVTFQHYEQPAWSDLLTLWRAYNHHLAHVIDCIPETRRTIPCVIGTDPPVTLGFLTGDYVAHLKHHLTQLAECAFAMPAQIRLGVTIRPYEESDAGDLCAATRESVSEVSPWMPWCHSEYSVADATDWVRLTKEGHRSGSMYEFKIQADGEFAGSCGINHINRVDGVANIGYWVRTALTSRGIASAALAQLVAWGFEHTPLHRLEIVAAVDNVRSQRVAEKVGARQDAFLQERTIVRGLPSDAFLYSIVRPD